MYPVSNAFLEAVKANTRKYYWTGRITTTAGTVYNFNQDDMVKGSGYITSQCCGSTEIELGTVYAAEMGISLFSEINRYTLEDAKVELFYHLQVAGGSYETIPMGIFEVSEANRKAKCLEIKAYDYMVRFEKAFTSLESIGNAYDFMVLCSTASRLPVALRSSASAKLYQKWSKTPELRGFRGFSFSNGLTQFDRTKPLLTRFLWVKWWTTTPKRGLMG